MCRWDRKYIIDTANEGEGAGLFLLSDSGVGKASRRFEAVIEVEA